MLSDAKKIKFEAANWTNSMKKVPPCLFNDARIDQNTVPDGWFLYEVRDYDCSENWCEIAQK